jgi:hypothetical protein
MKGIGVFLFFGSVMASLAGATLIWRGTLLDHMWTLNAPAYKQLSPLGKTVGIPFLVLSATLAAAGVGWFGRCLWGWRLAVVIIATQVLGDLVSILLGHFVRARRVSQSLVRCCFIFFDQRSGTRSSHVEPSRDDCKFLP